MGAALIKQGSPQSRADVRLGSLADVEDDVPLCLRKQTSLTMVRIRRSGFPRAEPVPGLPFPLVRCRRSSTGYGQDRHYLHTFAREDCEVRMVFEKLRGGFI